MEAPLENDLSPCGMENELSSGEDEFSSGEEEQISPDIERTCQLFHKPGRKEDEIKKVAKKIQKESLNPWLRHMLEAMKDKQNNC